MMIMTQAERVHRQYVTVAFFFFSYTVYLISVRALCSDGVDRFWWVYFATVQ
jgi:hypothetical protein